MNQTEVGQSIFVARQPIFDAGQNTYAYELLFRAGLESYCGAIDGDSATLDVIANTFLDIGLEELTAGKPCFINFTRELLLRRTPQLLPPDVVTVEILEDVVADEEVFAICLELKEAGYTLALDDFVISDWDHPLLGLAGIVKVDFPGTTPEERALIAKRLADRGIWGLAEKVETREEFEQARLAGYTYFQGYFFGKPVTHEGKVLEGSSMAYLRLLQEVNSPNLSYDELEAILKQDVSLMYHLLRFINSVWFGLRHRITSVRHALVWLGPKEIRKWFALISLRRMADDKPGELMILALTRARMAEHLAEHAGLKGHASDLFLMGMFSVLDAMLDRPIDEILSQLPINPQIKQALFGEPCPFQTVYDVILAFERADWGDFGAHAAALNVQEETVQSAFTRSVKWATEALAIAS